MIDSCGGLSGGGREGCMRGAMRVREVIVGERCRAVGKGYCSSLMLSGRHPFDHHRHDPPPPPPTEGRAEQNLAGRREYDGREATLRSSWKTG